MLQATVEISRSHLFHNIHTFREIFQKGGNSPLFCAVVKSNAYGHGLSEMGKLAWEGGADVLGVNNPEEAKILRSFHSQMPILIMGDIPQMENRAEELADENYWILVSRLDQWRFLSRLSPRPKIHLKVDTGMGRLGTWGEKLFTIVESGKGENLPLDGIATHFASTEDFTEHSYSMLQLNRFKEAIEFVENKGYTNLVKHCTSSASSLLFDEARMDMVRVGISLYGLWPSLETKLSMNLLNKDDIILKPVLTWKTRIRHIQEVPAGSYIGYGSTYKTTYPTRIAIIPVGYYEGLDRKLSNNGYFLIHGERARILGRVCMNMTILDITHIDSAMIEDEVVMIGSSGGEYLSVDTISSWTGTINYETVTKILPHFTRIVNE